MEAGIGQQHYYIGVVMREPAVLGLFRMASGIRNPNVRGHDDVRCARVYGRIVVVDRERWAVEELP